MNEDAIMEAAYLSGFEPSEDNLTGEDLLKEANDFLFTIIFK
nr:MAG TPA: hypothetical protein [Caudoviricetes sp.]